MLKTYKSIYVFLNFALFFGFGILNSVDSKENFHFRKNYTTIPTPTKIQLSLYCKPEVFYHDYVINDEEIEPARNSWNLAKINRRSTLNRICLQPNGLPVTRKCLFDPKVGPVWEPIGNWSRVRCIEKPQQQIITSELTLLHDKLLDSLSTDLPFEKRRDLIRNVLRTLEKPKSKFLPADVYHTTETLHYVFEYAKDAGSSQDIVGIFKRVMSMNKNVLRRSAVINSTNHFLTDFEDFMDTLAKQFVPSSHCHSPIATKISSTINNNNSRGNDVIRIVETIDFSYIGVYAHLSTDVSVFFINPSCANITGIIIYDLKVRPTKNFFESEGQFFYRFVYKNETAKEIAKEPGIQVASFVPKSLWENLSKRLAIEDQYIVIKVYSHDSLFVQTSKKQSCSPSSKIISISIPGFSGKFPEPLPFLMRNIFYDPKSNKPLPASSGCGYWNYETWLRDDVETAITKDINESVVLCFTGHLTQFSYLLGGQYRSEEPSDEILITPLHKKALDIITLVGCSLSLLGLLGIWLTAALFKNWRTISSTKVLLHLCLALTLQMVLFLFVNTHSVAENLVREKSYSGCVAVGALLQYSTLVIFAWMLIIALLQFQRYVTVIGIERPRRYILKSAIAAWGIPIIPTLIVAFVDPDGYIPSIEQLNANNGVCYPTGYGLTFGIVLPITIICIANLTIFIFVFYSISNTLNQAMQRQETLLVKNQIRLSVLLFFLLGICWIFGALAYLNHNLIFSYLFCLTATIQGFVLFLYFVILSEVPRKAWCQLLFARKQKIDLSKQREMESITGSTGVERGSSRRK